MHTHMCPPYIPSFCHIQVSAKLRRNDFCQPALSGPRVQGPTSVAESPASDLSPALQMLAAHWKAWLHLTIEAWPYLCIHPHLGVAEAVAIHVSD